MIGRHGNGRRFLGALLVMGVVGACASPHRTAIREGIPTTGWSPVSGGAAPGVNQNPDRIVMGERQPEGTYPIDLAAVLELAGAKSLVIEMAREQAAATASREELVMSRWFPTAGPRIGYTRIDGLVQGTAGDFVDVGKQNLIVGLGAEWRLDAAGTWYAALAARRRTEAAAHDIAAAGHDSLHKAAHLYYDLVRAHAAMEIANRTRDAATELVAVTSSRFRVGVGIDSDVKRAEARVSQAAGDLARAQRDAGVASARLVEQLLLDPATRLVPGGTGVGLVGFVDEATELGALFDRARRQRPDLAAARSRLAGAENARRGADVSWWWPTVAARGAVGGYGQNLGRLDDQESFYVGLEWTVGPGTFARQREAEAVRRGAALSVTGVERMVLRQIQQARARIKASRAALLAARQERTAAAEVVALEKKRLEAGEGLLLSVLDAETARVRAERSHADAVLDFNRGQYDLLHAVGGPAF